MATILATIKARRGAKQDFDATKMKAGELAVTTDGSDEAYLSPQNGRAIEFLKSILGKADKKIPAASGNLAALDGSGNLLDSGKKYPVNATASAAGLMSSSDKAKLDGIAAGAQVNTITGVKGGSESSYRTGNVSISAENVGAVAKVSPATAGNLAVLTADGGVTDIGKKPTPAGLGALPGVESSTAGCYTRTVDGVTEWINPPMAVGVEYRTTERYNGKALYTKLLDLGALPVNSSKAVSTGLPSGTSIVYVQAFAVASGNMLPLTFVEPLQAGKQYATCWITGNGQTINTYTSYPSITAQAAAIIKYYKS